MNFESLCPVENRTNKRAQDHPESEPHRGRSVRLGQRTLSRFARSVRVEQCPGGGEQSRAPGHSQW
jgi:hypothetical protein